MDERDIAYVSPRDALTINAERQLEAEILHAVGNSKYLRKDLAQIARDYKLPYAEIETIAQRLAKERGIDLEQAEFNHVIHQIKQIETEKDPGFRDWKMQGLARKLGRTRRELNEVYAKAIAAQQPLKPMSLSELAASSAKSVAWAVQGWLPLGNSLLLHGHGGTGKSLLAYGIAAAVAKGEPWNGYVTTQGRVLIVQSEEPAQVTASRLEALGLEDAPVDVVKDWVSEKMATLETYLRQKEDEGDPVKLVLVDSLTAININSSAQEKDAEYATPVLELTKMADRFGVALILIHHSNADGNSRGTTAIHNSACEVWALSIASEATGQRLLRVQKVRTGRIPGRYLFDFEAATSQFTYVGQEGEQVAEKETNEKRLELWLTADQHRGTRYEPEELAITLGMPKDSTRRALAEMWAKGIVKRDKRKKRGGGFTYYVESLQGGKVITQKTSDHLSDHLGESSLEGDRGQGGNLITQNPDFLQKRERGENADYVYLSDQVPTLGYNPDGDGVSKVITKVITAQVDPQVDHLGVQLDQPDAIEPGDCVQFLGKGRPGSTEERWRDAVFVRQEDKSMLSKLTGRLSDVCWVQPRRGDKVRVALADIRWIGPGVAYADE